MLRRAIAIVLLASFGLLAAAETRAAAATATGPAGRSTCCCCDLAEAPGAVVARLCCSLRCGKPGESAPVAPTSGSDAPKCAPAPQPAAAPAAAEPPATNPVSVLIAATERAGHRRALLPLYVTNATFLI